MPMTSAHWYARLQLFSRIGAIIVLCIGGQVLLGWLFDISFLMTGLPGWITMKVNTAIGFMAAGLSLWFGRSAATGRGRRAGLIFGAVTLLIGGATAIEHLFQFDLGIDELFFIDDPTIPGVVLNGRMSPITSVSFCVAGLSLLLLSRGTECSQRWALWCAVPVLLLAIQAMIGYAYGVRSLYQVLPYSAMAIHTVLGFLLLSTSILAAIPAQSFMKIIVSETAGGFVARRVLPVIIVGLFVLGRVNLAGEEAGWYGDRFSLALLVLMAMGFCAAIVLWNASVLYRVDLQRSLAVAEIVTLNEDLERKVKERTQVLQKALDDVKQLSGLLPICAWCKKIRDDKDYWHSVEGFIIARTDATFTHGVCPQCFAKAMADDGATLD